jgi:hypothetical protein
MLLRVSHPEDGTLLSQSLQKQVNHGISDGWAPQQTSLESLEHTA